jgi:hypothetical protein
MAKKVCEIIRNTTRPGFDAIEVGGAVKRFPANSGLITTEDHAAAREVKDRYGSDVVVIEGAEDPPKPGERRLWTVPELPWKRKKEL